ncbi:MAG: AgmX/PglI C-terminal domain-containing protein [Polyangiales bacterium]
MSAVQQDKRPRVLRVGLVQEGRIVEERTLKANESLRVGASEKNELLIDSPALGASYRLVQARDGGYTLRVPRELTGRVSDGDNVRVLEGEECELVLGHRSRGRLEIGDAVILFQFVPEVAQGERAQLPVAVRGGFGRTIDWVFTSFVLASYMGFFGLVIYLENADWELEAPYLVPELAARLVFNEPPPPMEMPQPVLDEAAPEDVTPEDVVAQDSVTPQRGERRDSAPRQTAAQEQETVARNARIRDMALASAHNLMIGSLGGENGPSAVTDLLLDGAPTQNAREVLATVSTVEFASRRADTLRDRSGGLHGSGTGVGIGEITPSDAEEVTTGPIEETRPRAFARTLPPIDDRGDGELDMTRVASTVRRRMSAIRACYERELNTHPDLAGKVVIEFTVQESGSVTGAHAIENLTGSTRLASCLSRVARGIRLSPGPQGGSVTIQYPFVFALQQ